MTVKDLIERLQKYDQKLPICINDYMGFIEAYEESIKIEYKKYRCYPFTEDDKFDYINLKGMTYDD